jgi:Polyketide cyclase / dehydrase and lipid transport
MLRGRSDVCRTEEAEPAGVQRAESGTGLYRLVSSLFARGAVSEAIATQAHIDASPERVWSCIMFYEEVPGRLPFLLRALFPCPVRAEGGKTDVGARVQCTYRRGNLVKRITSVKSPNLMEFDVVEQHLGIEGCVQTVGGSYQIGPCGNGTDIVLTTHYRAYLCPRNLWRPLEAILIHRIHTHILSGVRDAIPARHQAVRSFVREPFGSKRVLPRGFACKVSQFRSRR